MANGLNVPQGVILEIPMHCIHMDEGIYPNEATFDQFRFVVRGSAGGSGDVSKGQKKALTTIDQTFFTFGFSRNACPGRFFGAHAMKTMMAIVMMNYEVEKMGIRPRMIEVMEFRSRSQKTTIKVRRRQNS